MPNRSQVNVKVDPSMKQRWEEHVSGSVEVNSLSDLIRLSVERKISGELDMGVEGDSEHLEEISKTLKDIQRDIGQLDTRLSRVETSTQEDPELDKLANDIFPLLPDKEPGTRAWEEQLRDYRDEIEAIEGGHKRGDKAKLTESLQGWKGTPRSLSQAFGGRELDARKALEKLLSDMARVRTTEHNGKERYWRDL